MRRCLDALHTSGAERAASVLFKHLDGDADVGDAVVGVAARADGPPGPHHVEDPEGQKQQQDPDADAAHASAAIQGARP